MVEYHYHEWFGSPEPCPALYIDVARPKDNKPFRKGLLAAIDTGSSLTALPMECRPVGLHSHGRVKVRWTTYPEGPTPAYIVKVTTEGLASILVEIIFYPNPEGYALIGRNLLKHRFAMLKGPEQILEISER